MSTARSRLHRSRRRHGLVTIAGFALTAMLLSACATSGPSPDATTASSAPTTVDPSTTPEPTPAETAPTEEAPTSAPAFDKTAMSIDDPASLWVVSDKLRPLSPADYAPTDLVTVDVAHQNPPVLRKEPAAALLQLFAAGEAEGAGAMQVQSAYRSYATQVSVYDGWVKQLGQAQADIQSARPGYSEHQTGLVVDISPVPLSCALQACMGDTPQGKWLAANAWRYGWLLRYPADKTAVTGFTYEPWHFRYIGVPLATEMHDQHITTLEEFFGLPAAPTYAN
ncbi:D-alanyl-D-alanine carboxypeptidase family protein [Frigoribacterium sp. 2-23]|uniref:M15 family metallopeptidase n=1 Tax=Frigoribacterium sp. 2-23 TaxID=3415006 RepID=UPI003C6EA73F